MNIRKRPSGGAAGNGGSEGKEAATRRIKREESSWQASGSGKGEGASGRSGDGSTTDSTGGSAPRRATAEPRTTIHHGGEHESAANGMADPPVGWLVVVDGPGKGNARQIGHGMNGIGRDEQQRVRLDFGDSKISRHRHAVVTYDPKGQVYYLTHGEGDNLTYIGNDPVLQPVTLSAYDRITIGETTLLFLPLCGPQFEWT